jgi:hypothetical protein
MNKSLNTSTIIEILIEERAMPRTTKTSTPEPTSPPVAVNGSPSEIMSLAETAAYLRLPEEVVITATSTDGLPGRLVGGEWRFLKSAIHEWLSVSQPTAEMRKAAQMALAGAWKDDSDIEQIVEEAMRRRGRRPGPDGIYSGHRPAPKERS